MPSALSSLYFCKKYLLYFLHQSSTSASRVEIAVALVNLAQRLLWLPHPPTPGFSVLCTQCILLAFGSSQLFLCSFSHEVFWQSFIALGFCQYSSMACTVPSGLSCACARACKQDNLCMTMCVHASNTICAWPCKSAWPCRCMQANNRCMVMQVSVLGPGGTPTGATAI